MIGGSTHGHATRNENKAPLVSYSPYGRVKESPAFTPPGISLTGTKGNRPEQRERCGQNDATAAA
jgi:hypothetical protein